LNCGHKDGYTNAFIYRAWRCLAELEGQLARTQQQARYTELADRLKAVYAKTLYNPETGWLAWWKSADGQLHDYATPIVNGLAIEYGLIEPSEGRKILARLSAKMRAVHFTRFDLGLPCTLLPVRRADYLQPDGLGVPSREDGTDTFQNYMNVEFRPATHCTSSWLTISLARRRKATCCCTPCWRDRPPSDFRMAFKTRRIKASIGRRGQERLEATKDTLRTFSCLCRRLSCVSPQCARGFTGR
jgi:hypothetical protein